MTPQRQAILDELEDDQGVHFYEPEGLDRAIVGLACWQPTREVCVVYDYARILAYFVAQGMTEEEATEWIDFNVLGAWLGPTTPLVIRLSGPDVTIKIGAI